MYTTDYINTLITVAPDTEAVAATVPPTGKASVARAQFAMMHSHDYQHTSDEVTLAVFADRKDIAAQQRPVVQRAAMSTSG